MHRLRRCSFVLVHFLATTSVFSPPFVIAEASSPSSANDQQAPDVSNLSLEELTNVKVTSVSRKEESLAGAPAAIYIISSDDIKRSGMSSLPEVLRLAPGLTVQQTNSHVWSVSTRGFNAFPNEKMLVLIDGRAVYDPLYGGVYWDVQHVHLADIDRIEVIRGPGGALWGVNAVNGIINIITKPAGETLGTAMDTSLGADEGYQGSYRFGGRIGKPFAYRFYGQSSYWDPAVNESGAEIFNDWHMYDGGFRADWDVNANDKLTFDLAGYRGNLRDGAWLNNYGTFDTNPVAYEVDGGNIMAHWQHTFSQNSQANSLAYCDWNNREDSQFAAEYRATCDIEFQHDYKFNSRHSVTWGAGFRTTADRTPVTPTFHFTPEDQRLNFFDGFAQYDVNVIPDRLRVTIGSKFESSTYGGVDAQPQGRAVLKLARAHHIWAAISRSTRVPTRSDHDNLVQFFGPLQPPSPPTLVSFVGNPNLHSEHQTAYELGYRYNYRQVWSLDVATFYNSYTHLIHPDFNNPTVTFNPSPAYLKVMAPFINDVPIQTHGLEVNSKWEAARWWQLELNVTENRGTSFGQQAIARHQSSLRSQWDLSRHFSLNSALYHWSPFPAQGVVQVDVPAGNRIDTGMSWHGMHGLTIGLWGRNLQSDRHPEGNDIVVANGLVRRAIVGKISWDFSPDKKP